VTPNILKLGACIGVGLCVAATPAGAWPSSLKSEGSVIVVKTMPSPPRGVQGHWDSKDCDDESQVGANGAAETRTCCTFHYSNPDQTVGPTCTHWHSVE
jgi:hypothetical protein